MMPRGRVAALWAQALILGFAVAFAPALTALCTVLLLPGIAAWFLDTAHGRPMGRAVLTFGVAGALAPIWHCVQQGHTLQDLTATIVNSPAIITAWGMAGIGWMIGRLAQFAVELYLRSEANGRLRQLTVQRQALEAEWDLNAF